MPHGNGTGKVTIDIAEAGPGWIVFEAGKAAPSPAEPPYLLSRALIDWSRDNPSCVVRSTLPIVADGMTVAIHVWYDPG